MNNKRIKARQEIVGLLRGFYFLPIFLNLHKLGILNKFSNNRFISLYKLRYKNTIFIKRILDYLVRLDLFERKKSSYRITKFGIFISKRIGTMYILNSYSKIINNFSGNLTKVIKESSWCERKDNIIGSGLIHIKKFFEPSLKLINLNKTNNFLDIGCGDGTFLNVVKKANRNINILGCDLSNESVKQTQKKLFFKKNKNIFQSNGLDISKIKKKLKENKIELDENSIISLWFLLHEISNNSTKAVVDYLKKIRKNFPKTPILIGEISKFDDKLAIQQKSVSIMPEFMLFHELSGQGLLSEKQYLSIFRDSSYKLKKIIKTDNLKIKNNSSSSNFICLIEPKE